MTSAIELNETINPCESNKIVHETKINVGEVNEHKQDEADAGAVAKSIFPVSSSHMGHCSCVKRLCRHALMDTDDVILGQERRRLNKHLDKESEIFAGKYKYMKMVGDVFFSILKPPKLCQRGAAMWTYRGIQVLAIVYLVLFSFTRYALRSLCVEETFFLLASTKSGCMYCPSVQQQLKHSQYTQNITGYPGTLRFLLL